MVKMVKEAAAQDWREAGEGGLKKASMVNLAQILTINRSRFSDSSVPSLQSV